MQELIKEDRHETYCKIKASLTINITSINKILHEHKTVKKNNCSRWIPLNLTTVQKDARVNWYKEILKKYNCDASKAAYNIYTDEPYQIYAYELETKQQ